MKRYFFSLIPALSLVAISAAQTIPENEIWLLVRGDDMGSSHAANTACIESYQDGIVRSVELMVPCPWFPEAVILLNENPGLDVGIHLTLTSEWDNYKWRPLTPCPSLTDSNGYFFPMVWQREDFPPNTSLQSSNWDIGEIETELRAQIRMGVSNVPHATHVNTHMGFGQLDPEIDKLVQKLAEEFMLDIDLSGYGVRRFNGWGNAKNAEERIDSMVCNLKKLNPGIYLFIDHPAKDWPEIQALGHKGYENIAEDRAAVTQVFTSDTIGEVILQKNIKLISYRQLKEFVDP